MSKRIKIFMMIIVCFILCVAFVFIIDAEDEQNYNIHYSSNLLLDSMLYTGVDDLSVNPNKGSLKEGDVLVTTSENGLYMFGELFIPAK